MNSNKILKEDYKDLISGMIFGVLLLSWMILLITVSTSISEYDDSIKIQLLSILIVTAGVLVALGKLFNDQNWRRSEVYLHEAKELLQKSYDALKIEQSSGLPDNKRYTWLSSSRLLLAALDFGKLISEESHKHSFEEYCEYWRSRFRDIAVFEAERCPDKHYFFEDGALLSWTDDQRSPIAEPSIYVLYRFCKWPDGKKDRLEKGVKFNEDEITNMRHFGPVGLSEYLSELRQRETNK